MLILLDQIINTPLRSLQTGMEVGTLLAPIINEKTFKIIAWQVETPEPSPAPVVIHSEDLREFSPIGIIIDDEEKIMDATSLVRLQKIIQRGFDFHQLPVFSESGEGLGRIEEIAFDPEDFSIVQFFLTPALKTRLLSSTLIINKRQVVKLTKDKMIVRDNSKKLPSVDKLFGKASTDVVVTETPSQKKFD